jgi:CBS-domain-containing membrane protein
MKLLLNDKLTIEDLVRKVALGHERTLFIVNEQERLIGVVTQGDILRAIWHGAEMQSSAVVCINYNPITMKKEDPLHNAIDIFSSTGALVIPIVDENRNIINLVNVRELLK